jgi:F-type H+-transporting ATPase subunit delta
MKASVSDYAIALYDAVAEQPDQAHLIVERFTKQLRHEHQSRLLPLIMDKIVEVEALRNDEIVVKVTSAMPLTDAGRQQLTSQLQKGTVKQTITFQESVDPELIGGVTLQIGDTIVDASTVNALDQLAARLQRPKRRS